MIDESESSADGDESLPQPAAAKEIHCGFAAVVGRPNVGKSTLINALLGQKISIVSPKPQTTRHRILGILSQPDFQIAFVDTPGLHSNGQREMNRYMNRAARASLADADVNLFVVEALTWTDEDAQVLEYLQRCGRPIVVAINKVDKVYPKDRLLPYMQELLHKGEFAAVLPISGLKRDGLDQLPKVIAPHLPMSPPLFPDEQVTDRSEQFRAAEIIREKLTWQLHQELPYGITVEIERFENQEDGRLLINAVIWVERPGQKAIIIGQGGSRLKEIGTAARRELKYMFKRSVHLELWVKVKENWSDSEAALRQFGFE